MAGKLFKYLSKATSFSVPSSSSSSSSRVASAFSGPIAAIIPKDARRTKNADNSDAQEPASPKVSCIGQIKHESRKSTSKPPQPPQRKKPESSNEKIRLERKKSTRKHESFNEKGLARKKSTRKHQSFDEKRLKRQEEPRKEKKPSALQGMFRRKVRPGRPLAAPGVGAMKRYASGRGSLSDFDWRTVAVEPQEEVEEEEVIIPHSAPILMGGGVVAVEKRTEVNLWKRRTLAAPVPLRVNQQEVVRKSFG